MCKLLALKHLRILSDGHESWCYNFTFSLETHILHPNLSILLISSALIIGMYWRLTWLHYANDVKLAMFYQVRKQNLHIAYISNGNKLVPFIHSWFPLQWFSLERHSQFTIYCETFWHLISQLPHSNPNTQGVMGSLKPDVPNPQLPTGHKLTSCKLSEPTSDPTGTQTRSVWQFSVQIFGLSECLVSLFVDFIKALNVTGANLNSL